MAELESHQSAGTTHALSQKLDAVSWGVFFIWIGVAFLANVGWGAVLLGIGLIAFGTQAARRYFGLPAERFWLIIGTVFVVWGVWNLLELWFGETSIPDDALPVLFIAVGVTVIVSSLTRKPLK
jgi:hypothetical protein